ncbi:MAG: hypothetical protein LBQ19_05485 [Synergistaceae bacterium]|jgi:hypothetical protein|nr:hypothetical protein [Synergistaceae bacterium]
MHAYSELFAELQGIPENQLVHELAMLALGKQIDGSEPAEQIYARYQELRAAFLEAYNK